MTTRHKRRGGQSKRAPGESHQNSFGYKHNKNSKTTARILQLPNFGLCNRCTDIIEWRKKFRKYKALKDARKCERCSERRVVFAYHCICQECARKDDVCAKCKESGIITKHEKEAPEPELEGLKERQRRTILRMMERGELTNEDFVEDMSQDVSKPHPIEAWMRQQ